MKGTPYDSKGSEIVLMSPPEKTYSLKKRYSIIVKQTLSRANCVDYDTTYTYADCLQEGLFTGRHTFGRKASIKNKY